MGSKNSGSIGPGLGQIGMGLGPGPNILGPMGPGLGPEPKTHYFSRSNCLNTML